MTMYSNVGFPHHSSPVFGWCSFQEINDDIILVHTHDLFNKSNIFKTD